MEFNTEILHTFGNDNINCIICYSNIGIGIGDGILYRFSRDNVLLMGMLYGFAIIILTIILTPGVAGILG